MKQIFWGFLGAGRAVYPSPGKVFPCGIEALYQNNFLVARPAFHLRFPGDAIVHILKPLEIDQPVDFVSLGKALDLAFFVLHHSIEQGVCPTDINPMRLTRQDVDVEFSTREAKQIPPLRQAQGRNDKSLADFLAYGAGGQGTA